MLLDVKIPGKSKKDLLPEIGKHYQDVLVITTTTTDNIDAAVKSLKKGAYDYLGKPLDFDELKLAIERAMDHSRLKEENRALKESLGVGFNTGDIIGRSRTMLELLAGRLCAGLGVCRRQHLPDTGNHQGAAGVQELQRLQD